MLCLLGCQSERGIFAHAVCFHVDVCVSNILGCTTKQCCYLLFFPHHYEYSK